MHTRVLAAVAALAAVAPVVGFAAAVAAAPALAQAPPPPLPNVTLVRCDVPCRDLATSRAFYGAVLGCTSEPAPDGATSLLLGTPLAGVQLRLCTASDGGDGDRAGRARLRFAADLGAVRARLAAAGFEAEPTAGAAAGAEEVLRVRDPDGNVLEFAHAPAPAPAASPLDRAAFLVGTWRMQQGGSLFEELWSEPLGDGMLGFGRLVRGGKTAFFERLQLVARGDQLVYVAQPKGAAAPTEFVLTHAGANELVFENPEHDFPKRIRYRLDGAGVLHAVVDDGTDEGKRQTFAFRRRAP